MSVDPLPNPELLRGVNALLEVALSLDEDERSRWIQTLPPDQQVFVPLLTTLLARAKVETDDFMREPVKVPLDSLDTPDAPSDQPGDAIGPYRLIHELGSGGMATVWLSERVDGLLQRQVALKLPREGWALGLAQRMARERDILGSLEHPNIARLYDAGVTDRGRPWMAMERVTGVPIDQYCRENQLGVPQRLRLFLQVTEAVAHAHARLIVHRDLKPSNILVTPEGEVRLLDFGVAKLLEESPALAPNLTQLMGRAVTPDYASPEQVAGKPVTVATDVYSLGVVLYELLTGQRPYRLSRQSTAALEEAILAVNVPPASSRVHGERSLFRQLRGDIDTILIKAMRKNPSLRYSSVEALSADLQRHLDGEPVLAQAPSRRYRAWKFVRRNRLAFASLSAVTAAIVVGLSTALWQAREAKLEAVRAEQVKAFVASILSQAKPREGAGGTVTASDLLSAAALRIETEFEGNPRVAAELGVIVGEGFSSLGEPQKGEAPLRAAVARAEQAYGRRHPISLHGKALLVESLTYSNLTLADRLLDELVPDALAGLPATTEEAVFALRSKSYLEAKRDRKSQAYAALRQAIETSERHLGPLHRETIHSMGLLSNTYGRFGEYTDQLRTSRDALVRARSAFGTQRPQTMLTAIERWYGEALRNNDKPAEAEPVLRQVLQDQQALDGADSAPVMVAMLQLARALADLGRVDEALKLMRECVAMETRVNPVDSEDRQSFGRSLVDVLALARRPEEALALDQRIEAISLPDVKELPGHLTGRTVRRAQLLALLGKYAHATQLASEAAAQAGDSQAPLRARAWTVSAFNARMQGKPDETLSLAQRVLNAPSANGFRPTILADAASEAGNAWIDLGDITQAKPLLAHAQELLATAQVEPGVRTASTIVGIARVHLKAGQAKEAMAELRPLVNAWERVNPGSPWHGEALYWLSRAEAMSGQTSEARAHRVAATLMLKESKLPALRRLIEG